MSAKAKRLALTDLALRGALCPAPPLAEGNYRGGSGTSYNLRKLRDKANAVRPEDFAESAEADRPQLSDRSPVEVEPEPAAAGWDYADGQDLQAATAEADPRVGGVIRQRRGVAIAGLCAATGNKGLDEAANLTIHELETTFPFLSQA